VVFAITLVTLVIPLEIVIVVGMNRSNS